jgi:hypothetical protein
VNSCFEVSPPQLAWQGSALLLLLLLLLLMLLLLLYLLHVGVLNAPPLQGCADLAGRSGAAPRIPPGCAL